MAEPNTPLLPAEELEAARRDLQSANAAVAALPTGLVRQRLETALRGVDSEIQSQLWGHLDAKKQSSTTGPQGQQQQQQQQQQQGQSARGAGSVGVSSGGARRGSGPLSPTATVLTKADRAGVEARSPLHAAALALHCLLISKGFVCTGQDEKAQAVKGFAAPVKDVPEEKLVPDKWDADVAAVSFRYRRPDTAGGVYLFKAASSGAEGPTSFFLAQRGGETFSAGIDLGPLSDSDTRFFDNESFFEGLFDTFWREVLSRFLPQQARESEPLVSSVEDAREVILAPEQRPSPPPGNPPPLWGMDDDDPPRAGPPRFAGPPGVGTTPFMPGRGGDFGGDLFPTGGGMGGGGGGGLPGPGGLMGPGHPMFGGGSGAGYMEPRFDPYGPPMPGQPWGPGVPGGPSRGGPGRGGPNPESNRGPDGGPDNDHLPPPRGSDHMFF